MKGWWGEGGNGRRKKEKKGQGDNLKGAWEEYTRELEAIQNDKKRKDEVMNGRSNVKEGKVQERREGGTVGEREKREVIRSADSGVWDQV